MSHSMDATPPLAAKRSRGASINLSKTPVVSRDFLPEYEVKWEGPHDPHDPHNWSFWKRWYCVLVGAMLAVNATFASSAPSETIPSYIREFGISQEVGILTISLFVAGYCAGPLAWGPLSETFGRRNVFIVSFFVYTCMNVGCALAPNIGALLTFRFIAGTFAAAPLSNSGALVADVMSSRQLGIGMSIFALAPFAGPALGPTVGGFIQLTGTSWRWVYWVCTIFAGVCLVILILTLPETYSPLILQRRARRMRKESGDNRYWAPLDKKSTKLSALLFSVLVQPFKMLLEEPMLLVLTIYLSLVYGIVYLMFEALPLIMSGVHGMNPGITGLTFLGVFVGGTLGNLVYLGVYGPRYSKMVDAMAPKPVPPEVRLEICKISAFTLPIAMFWMGWTGNYESTSYWSPLLALTLLGSGIIMTFLSLFSYIVDTYMYAAATALSVNTVVRSAAGAGFPLFANQMFAKLGINWACTLLGCCCLLFSPAPFILSKYGHQIRAMSKNAPTSRSPPSTDKRGATSSNEKPSRNDENGTKSHDCESLGDETVVVEDVESQDESRRHESKKNIFSSLK